MSQPLGRYRIKKRRPFSHFKNWEWYGQPPEEFGTKEEAEAAASSYVSGAAEYGAGVDAEVVGPCQVFSEHT